MGIFDKWKEAWREGQRRAEVDLMRPIDVLNELKAVVAPHFPALSTRRAQLKGRDAYGLVQRKAWDEELARFCDGIVRPAVDFEVLAKLFPKTASGSLTSARLFRNSEADSPLWRAIDSMITAYDRTLPTDVTCVDAVDDPLEYETACRRLLEQSGWRAETTSASGDQGADVVATSEIGRLVVQCKRYGKPVGNKAVQEVIAAAGFVDADFAAVVSNQSYTRAAHELARKTKVLLLHHRELPGLLSRLHEKGPSEPKRISSKGRTRTG